MNKEQWKDKYLELAYTYGVLHEEHEKLKAECCGKKKPKVRSDTKRVRGKN